MSTRNIFRIRHTEIYQVGNIIGFRSTGTIIGRALAESKCRSITDRIWSRIRSLLVRLQWYMENSLIGNLVSQVIIQIVSCRLSTLSKIPLIRTSYLSSFLPSILIFLFRHRHTRLSYNGIGGFSSSWQHLCPRPRFASCIWFSKTFRLSQF